MAYRFFEFRFGRDIAQLIGSYVSLSAETIKRYHRMNFYFMRRIFETLRPNQSILARIRERKEKSSSLVLNFDENHEIFWIPASYSNAGRLKNGHTLFSMQNVMDVLSCTNFNYKTIHPSCDAAMRNLDRTLYRHEAIYEAIII